MIKVSPERNTEEAQNGMELQGVTRDQSIWLLHVFTVIFDDPRVVIKFC